MKFQSLTTPTFAAIALTLSACCHTIPPLSEDPPKVSGNPRMAIWLTDGSPSVFTDTEPFPKSKAYEGLPDSAPISTGTIPWTHGGYDGEAEFIVVFDRPLVDLPEIDHTTPARLRGLIETKTLSRLTGEGRIKWAPSSIGNNVMTGGPGLKLHPLARLKSKELEKTRLALTFTDIDGRHVSHSATLEDLPELDVLVAYIREVQEHCRENRHHARYREIRAVNLGAQGKRSGYVTECGRISGAIIGALACDPGCIFRRDEKGWLFPECVRRSLIGNVLHRNAGAAAGSDIELRLTSASGAPAGEARLGIGPR